MYLEHIQMYLEHIRIRLERIPMYSEHIQMADCKDLLEEGEPILTAIQSKQRTEDIFMCPNSTSLLLQGNFGTEEFKYMSVRIKSCILPEGECYSGTELEDRINS